MVNSNNQISNQNVWLNINKTAGCSSAKVVAIVKKITKAKKVGHCGTLDPFATGVLPIALNKATKTCSYITDAVKKYYFEITWGEFRDSDDITGKVIEKSDLRPKTQAIIDILTNFVGKIEQKPSIFSAIKIDGQRSYQLARQGLKFEIKSREVEIFQLKLISNNHQKSCLEVLCSKGTYIRSLARDISKKLGVCGYVSVLERLQVGNFTINKTILLANLENIVKYHAPANILLQLRDVLNLIPEVQLNSFDSLKIKNGQLINLTISPDSIGWKELKQNNLTVKVLSQGNLISLATIENNVLKPLSNF